MTKTTCDRCGTEISTAAKNRLVLNAIHKGNLECDSVCIIVKIRSEMGPTLDICKPCLKTIINSDD